MVVEAGAGGFEVFLVEAEGLVEVAELVFAGGPVPGELVADFGGQGGGAVEGAVEGAGGVVVAGCVEAVGGGGLLARVVHLVLVGDAVAGDRVEDPPGFGAGLPVGLEAVLGLELLDRFDRVRVVLASGGQLRVGAGDVELHPQLRHLV